MDSSSSSSVDSRSMFSSMLLRMLLAFPDQFLVSAQISPKHTLITLGLLVLASILVVKNHARLTNFGTKVSDKIRQILEMDSSSSANSRDVFKDLEECFRKMFSCLRRRLDIKRRNEEIIKNHYIIYTAYLYIVMAVYLISILSTLFRQHVTRPMFSIILLLILLQCVLLFSVLAQISLKHALIILALYILAVKFHAHLKKFSTKASEKISQLYEMYVSI